jgi:hypothetical protein
MALWADAVDAAKERAPPTGTGWFCNFRMCKGSDRLPGFRRRLHLEARSASGDLILISRARDRSGGGHLAARRGRHLIRGMGIASATISALSSPNHRPAADNSAFNVEKHFRLIPANGLQKRMEKAGLACHTAAASIS